MSAVTLIYCVFIFNAPRSFFRDSDTGWQIVTGEKILNEHQVPHTDPFSFARQGEPWIAWGWASDCVMGFANTHGGLPAVVWLFALTIATVTWLWFRLHWECGGNFFFAFVFALPMIAAAQPRWLAGPHIFGWVLLLATLLYFEKAPAQFRIRDAFLVACAGALWANLDASFVLLPAIALIYGFSHFVRPFIWQTETEIDLRKGRWFVMAALFSAFATLLNPYGWNLYHHLSVPIDSEIPINGAALVALGIAAIGGTLALCEKKLAHFLIALLFVGGAIRSPRLLPLMALVMLPLANGAITQALHRAKDLRVGLRRALSSYLFYSDRLRLLDARYSGIAWAPPIAALLWLILQTPAVASHAGFPPEEFPIYGANEVAQLSRNIRLLAPGTYGGYLIYRFRGTLKVFTYTNTDHLVWMSGYGFTQALLPNDSPIITTLEQMGWKVLFRDDQSTLLSR